MSFQLLCRVIRRAVAVAMTVVLMLLAFETGANLLYWHETGKLYLLAHTAPAAFLSPDVVFKLHPYFGFMPTYSEAAMKNRGLLQNNFNFPQVKVYIDHVHNCCNFPISKNAHQDQYFIAVLGDSIAHGLGDYYQVYISQNLDPTLQARLQEIPAAKGKHAVLLNLAVPGHHPPQQLLELAYLLAGGSKFDLILYYASAQALLSARGNEVSGKLMPDYPDWGVWTSMTRALEQSASADALSLIGLYELRSAQRTQARLDNCQMASCVMINRPLLKLQRYLATELAPPASADASAPHFIDFRPTTPPPEGPNRYAGYAEAWKRNCLMMADMAHRSGAEYLQVLLPNPWTHPSGVEFNAAGDPHGELATESRPALAAMVTANAQLRQDGIRALDATHVLDKANGNDPQVFLDGTGHMGQTGLKVVADYTVDHLIDPKLQ